MENYYLIFLMVAAIQFTGSQQESERAYKLDPLPGAIFGKEVREFSLKDLVKNPDEKVINQMIKDVRTHRALVFRDQGVLTGDEQVNVTRWFGEAVCDMHLHQKSPHRCIYRLGNEKHEGITDRGKKWHLDGSYRDISDDFVFYHVQVAPERGPTLFMPLKECVDLLGDRLKDYLRLSYRLGDTVHPVLAAHPFSEDTVFRPHFFSIRDYIWDYGTEEQRITTHNNERNGLHNEMTEHFEKTCKDIIYPHKWTPGDFIITDNRALSHRAGDDATLRPHEIGMRIIHRTNTYARDQHRYALGYVKRAERREQYLKNKEALEKEFYPNDVEDAAWCPEGDDQLCGEHGALIKELKADENQTGSDKDEL